jgi:hypothetical protein
MLGAGPTTGSGASFSDDTVSGIVPIDLTLVESIERYRSDYRTKTLETEFDSACGTFVWFYGELNRASSV